MAAKDAHLGELRIALDVERAWVNRLIERRWPGTRLAMPYLPPPEPAAAAG